MKKALSVFLMLALVGSVFAAEPVADVNIAEFTGDASVQWGVNLDNNKTGFQNSANVTLKLNLLNEGSKSTTGDGVWGELVIKTNGDTFAKATNTSALALPGMTVVVDTAKIHFGPAYIGITSGNTQTGELKMDAAVKSADHDNSKILSDVGPGDYSQGITLGYDHDMFSVAADVRSHNKVFGVWKISTTGPTTVNSADITDLVDYPEGTSSSDLPATPLTAYYGNEALAKAVAAAINKYYKSLGTSGSATVEKVGDYNPAGNQYTDAYAFALEGELKPIENLSIKAGVSYNYEVKEVPLLNVTTKDKFVIEKVYGPVQSILGYSASAGYKLALGDTFYLRPQVGFTGQHNLSDDSVDPAYNIAGGLLFGWGDIGVDANPDVYYLDTDDYKKVSPGVGVVVSAPIKEGATITIAPSFFSGDIIPGLTAATYANMTIATADTAKPGEKFTYSVLNGMKYAIPVGAGTITPQLGTELGGNDDKAINTFKVKAGVDVAGFVANTTFFTVYDSGNLLMEKYVKDGDPKLGTLNFGAKISF